MIERLAEQVFNDIRDKASEFSAGVDGGAPKIKALIEAKLRKLNLVTREEFDAQSSVLARTREELDATHAQIQSLSEQLDALRAQFEDTK